MSNLANLGSFTKKYLIVSCDKSPRFLIFARDLKCSQVHLSRLEPPGRPHYVPIAYLALLGNPHYPKQ